MAAEQTVQREDGGGGADLLGQMDGQTDRCYVSWRLHRHAWEKKPKPTSKKKDHSSFHRGEIKTIEAHDPGDKSKSKPKVYLFLQHLNETPFMTVPKGSYPSVTNQHMQFFSHP